MTSKSVRFVHLHIHFMFLYTQVLLQQLCAAEIAVGHFSLTLHLMQHS